MGIADGLKRGTIELVLLSLLQEGDKYGYEICQQLEQRSGGQFVIKEGSLYPTLYRLLDKGMISDRKEKVGTRRIRVYYHLEDAGKAYLREIRREYLMLNHGIFRVLGYTKLEEFGA
ncbi:MAG: PadR family transcriptional regulator [Acutalibacteraceae bacterium]|jgi:PadR family transcriptional regulator PadR